MNKTFALLCASTSLLAPSLAVTSARAAPTRQPSERSQVYWYRQIEAEPNEDEWLRLTRIGGQVRATAVVRINEPNGSQNIRRIAMKEGYVVRLPDYQPAANGAAFTLYVGNVPMKGYFPAGQFGGKRLVTFVEFMGRGPDNQYVRCDPPKLAGGRRGTKSRRER